MLATSYPWWYALYVRYIIGYAPFDVAILISLVCIPWLCSPKTSRLCVGLLVVAIAWGIAIPLYYFYWKWAVLRW